jgi:hypothetical protein
VTWQFHASAALGIAMTITTITALILTLRKKDS